MARIESSVTLYTGVPLDNSYEHTLTSKSLLENFTNITLPDSLVYIRPDKNTIQIEHSQMNAYSGGQSINLYQCNYLSFKNTTYENRRFYCFVTGVRYISDKTAEIDFEVDVMMTWLKHNSNDTGCEFEQCFVEREHTASDKVGAHILEEPVDIGDYVVVDSDNTSFGLRICACVAGQYNDTERKWAPFSYDVDFESGLYCCDGLMRYYFESTGMKISGDTANPFASLSQLFESFLYPNSGAEQGIVKSIYYYPYISSESSLFNVTAPANLDTYTPTNKKLYTYPYCCCEINNYEGQSNIYAFELSSLENVDQQSVLSFQMCASKYDAMASLYPISYAQGDKNMMITKAKYPVLSASSNEYNSYRTNLRATVGADLVSNIAIPAATGALIGSGLIGATVGAGAGLISYVTQAFAGGEQAKLKGSTPIGSVSGFLQAGNDTLNFGAYVKTIRKEYAQAIDDFFTKFGYKVNRLKVPTLKINRLNYKYIKTVGCALKGYAPATAMSKIQSIMDNGITFWKTANVGDYS